MYPTNPFNASLCGQYNPGLTCFNESKCRCMGTLYNILSFSFFCCNFWDGYGHILKSQGLLMGLFWRMENGILMSYEKDFCCGSIFRWVTSLSDNTIARNYIYLGLSLMFITLLHINGP